LSFGKKVTHTFVTTIENHTHQNKTALEVPSGSAGRSAPVLPNE